jgi:peptidase E
MKFILNTEKELQRNIEFNNEGVILNYYQNKICYLIGGGKFDELTTIYEDMISNTNKKNPTTLFINHGNKFGKANYDKVKKIFQELGSETKYLHKEDLDDINKTKELVNSADIIYIGTGNTKEMLDLWKEKKFDDILIEAFNNGKIMAGISAGAISLSRYGLSDYLREEDEKAKLVKLDGLGMVDLLTLPHANKDSFNDEDINKESKDIDCYLISNKACVKVFNDDVSFMLIDDGFIDIVKNGKTEHIL